VRMIVTLRRVRGARKLGVRMLVPGRVVRMRPGRRLVGRRRPVHIVAMRVAVPVNMGVAMAVHVRVAVDDVAVTMQVRMHVLVLVGVLVLMLVFVLDGLRCIVAIVRVVVRQAFTVWHGSLLRTGSLLQAPAERKAYLPRLDGMKVQVVHAAHRLAAES